MSTIVSFYMCMYSICVYKLATFPHCDLFDREARAPTVTPRAGTEKEKNMKEKKTYFNPLQIISEILSRSNQNLDSTSKSCKAERGFVLARNNVLLVSLCLLIGYRPLSLGNPPDKKITNLD